MTAIGYVKQWRSSLRRNRVAGLAWRSRLPFFAALFSPLTRPQFLYFALLMLLASLILALARFALLLSQGQSAGSSAVEASFLIVMESGLALMLQYLLRHTVWPATGINASSLLAAAIILSSCRTLALWAATPYQSDTLGKPAVIAVGYVLSCIVWCGGTIVAQHLARERSLLAPSQKPVEPSPILSSASASVAEPALRGHLIQHQEDLRRAIAERIHGRVQTRLLVAQAWLH